MIQKPSWKRRILASDQLPLAVRMFLALGTPIVFLVRQFLVQPTIPDIEYLLWLALIAFLLFFTGWFTAIVASWLVLGPILHAQGRSNGGPFNVGDRVQILTGPHSETVTRVYAKGQHETNRVELGEEAREDYRDIFADYQLLRIPVEHEPPKPPGSISSSVPALDYQVPQNDNKPASGI